MTKLFIGNLSYQTTDDQLREAFSKAGSSFVSAEIVTDRMSGRSRGFGFVKYENDEDAQAAISMWDGKELDGRPLKVNVAKPREDRPEF